LKDLFRLDCRKLGLDPDAPEQQEAYDQAFEDLERYVESSTSYFDEYRSKTANLATNEHLEGCGKYSPNIPSVDGVFSFFECDGKLRYHCKGNVAVTSVALNYLKATHNPALLSHISEFSRSPKTRADQIRVLKKATNSALIRLKVPYKVRTRLKRPLSKSQFRSYVMRFWST
jgi:hypothetical protein